MSDIVRISYVTYAHFAGLEVPFYASCGAAGLDMRAACGADAPVCVEPGQRCRVPTGMGMMIPPGYEGQIRSRSGLALREGLVCLNAPGTIDSDYRGEIQVLLANLGETSVRINRGDRIAQLVIAPVARAQLVPVAALESSGRGQGGFGSTGVE